jgi:F-type H+-transporting ATPase subunit a
MEHHASYLATLLTDLMGLQRRIWDGGAFAHGQVLSWLERYDHLFAAVLAALTTVFLVWMLRARMSRVPGPFQQIMEMAVSFVRNMVGENVERRPEAYVPLVGTMGFFILLNNLFGLTPLPSATGNWNVTLACALVVFCYYNWHGMKEHGAKKYWGHFLGPVWWLSPLMLPIEIIGLLSRILSHSLRLFGNIAGEHVVAAIFFGMLPLLLPVPMMFLGIFFGLIQTFVFIMLTSIYISGAVSHEH